MNSELADVHFVYDTANFRGSSARELHNSRLPTRRISTHTMFARLNHRLVETRHFDTQMSAVGFQRRNNVNTHN